MDLLIELGIAPELTGKRRNRRFVYDRYLATLNEGTERPFRRLHRSEDPRGWRLLRPQWSRHSQAGTGQRPGIHPDAVRAIAELRMSAPLENSRSGACHAQPTIRWTTNLFQQRDNVRRRVARRAPMTMMRSPAFSVVAVTFAWPS
jgi:hypothetical protein